MNNKLIDRINKLNQYESWHFVKQNYNFEVVKYMIQKISLWQKNANKESFEKFIKKEYINSSDKAFSNFRNARTLVGLNLILNPSHSIDYKDYKICKQIENAALNNKDQELKKLMTERMFKKDKIFKSKSNKASSVSISNEVLNIKPFEITINVMIELFNKTKNNFLENEEISNFISTATEDVTVDEIVSVILDYRQDSTILKNKIKENRFHLTLPLFEGIEKQGRNIIFNIDALKKNFNLYNFENNQINIKNNVDKDNIAKYIVNSSETTTRNPELQKLFRNELKIEFIETCAFCLLKGDKIVVASHIKSVKESFEDGLYDEFPNSKNGLLLCYNHDALFDNHIISIDEYGVLIGNTHDMLTHASVFDFKWFKNKERKKFLKIHHQHYLNKLI